jgi:uncharacterized protein YdaU (DUF1376 family)
MAEKSPAFQFYPRDFLVDTSHMSNAAVGLYIRLLAREWMDGSIPADPQTSRIQLPKTPPREFTEIWDDVRAMFVEHPTDATRLIQKRLEAARTAQDSRRERLRGIGARGGKASAKARGASPMVNHMLEHKVLSIAQGPASASASASASAPPPEVGEEAAETAEDAVMTPLEFGRHFIESALAVGAIGAHRGLDILAEAMREDFQSAAALLATYPRAEIDARLTRYLAAVVAKKIHKCGIAHFVGAWDWQTVSGVEFEPNDGRPKLGTLPESEMR